MDALLNVASCMRPFSNIAKVNNSSGLNNQSKKHGEKL